MHICVPWPRRVKCPTDFVCAVTHLLSCYIGILDRVTTRTYNIYNWRHIDCYKNRRRKKWFTFAFVAAVCNFLGNIFLHPLLFGMYARVNFSEMLLTDIPNYGLLWIQRLNIITHTRHWGRGKMTHIILQTTFSNAFCWVKMFDFDQNFTEVCGSNWQYASIGSANGLEPNRRHVGLGCLVPSGVLCSVSMNFKQTLSMYCFLSMMTSSNGSIFRVNGHLRGEFTGPTKASDPELWCFLLSASE